MAAIVSAVLPVAKAAAAGDLIKLTKAVDVVDAAKSTPNLVKSHRGLTQALRRILIPDDGFNWEIQPN